MGAQNIEWHMADAHYGKYGSFIFWKIEKYFEMFGYYHVQSVCQAYQHRAVCRVWDKITLIAKY